MRVLLASSREKGHLHPLLPVARRLVEGGAEVHWLLLPAPPRPLPAVAATFHALDEAFPEGFTTGGAELAGLVRDPVRLRGWIRGLLIEGVGAQRPRIRALLDEVRPQAVVTDPMLYAVALEAHRAGLPWLGVSSSLNPAVPEGWSSDLIETVGSIADDRSRMFVAEGLEPHFAVCDALSPHGTTVFAGPTLVGPRALRPGVALVGPSRHEDPRGDEPPEVALPDEPFAYASFGSQIAWQPEAYARVARIAARQGLRLVISGGTLADDPGFRAGLPRGALVLRYAPQEALLAKARWFWSHGGANSVSEALSAGTPLILEPVCNDQPHTARFAEEAGLALVVGSPGDEAQVALDVEAFVADPRSQALREEARAEYGRLDGARAVARRVLGWAR